MTEEEKPTDSVTGINWEKGENIPHDAVQYWGECKNCHNNAFVHKSVHMCCQCLLKVKPEIPPSADIVVPEEESVIAEPLEKPSEAIQAPKVDPDEIKKTETKKRGRPKGSKNKGSKNKDGFSPRTKVTKISPAKFDVAVPSGPVGEWMFDEKKKGWVVKDEQGRAIRFSKEKPSEAK